MRRLGLLVLGLLLALGGSAGAVTATRVTVSTTATLIYTAPPGSVGSVLVRNPSAVSVYLGTVAITTATGFELPAGASVQINLYNQDRLYGIVAAATQEVQTLSGSNPQ